jgi:hypothetical protein
MSTLPIDRTNLNLAIANQVPSQLIQSAKNINAISTLYDGSDAVYNYLIAALATFASTAGAATVGTSVVAGLSSANVQDMLAEMELQVQSLQAGVVPSGSITSAMIQNLAITTAKIALLAVTSAQMDVNAQADLVAGRIYGARNLGGM